MIIQAFPSGPLETNAYVIACPKSREAVIIDPAPGCFSPLVNFLNQMQLVLKAIWLTHSHWDHIANTAAFKEKYSVPVIIHSLDEANLKNPGSDRLPCWLPIEGVIPDRLIDQNDQLPVGDFTFTVIHTPGHTPGGVCFYCPSEKILICGDTLFKGTIGSLSLPTAQPDSMWSSLDKLVKLPFDTRVFPGHGPSTTIGDENWLPKARELFEN